MPNRSEMIQRAAALPRGDAERRRILAELCRHAMAPTIANGKMVLYWAPMPTDEDVAHVGMELRSGPRETVGSAGDLGEWLVACHKDQHAKMEAAQKRLVQAVGRSFGGASLRGRGYPQPSTTPRPNFIGMGKLIVATTWDAEIETPEPIDTAAFTDVCRDVASALGFDFKSMMR